MSTRGKRWIFGALTAVAFAVAGEIAKDLYHKVPETVPDIGLPVLGTPCSKCGGSGWYTELPHMEESGGIRSAEVKCPDCGGTGRQR
jgi:hypothetical protein